MLLQFIAQTIKTKLLDLHLQYVLSSNSISLQVTRTQFLMKQTTKTKDLNDVKEFKDL